MLQPQTSMEELLPRADDGDIDAQFQLGKYYFGEHAGYNREMGEKWLTRAAEAGHIEAQFQLSRLKDGETEWLH